MQVSQGAWRFISATAVRALLAFDAAVVFISVTIIILYSTHDPRSLVYREPLLIWIPFAIAILFTIALALAAGAGALRAASCLPGGRWTTPLRVLLVLALLMLVLLILARSSAEETILIPLAALLYLDLPALALLSIGHRAGLRVLALGACVEYAMTIALLVLTFLSPRFGMDPTQVYFIYLPPQFIAAALTLGAGALSSMAAGIACAIDGRQVGRQNWSRCFQVAIVAGGIGPVALALQLHYPPLLTMSPALEVALVTLAGAAYLALPVLALVYARKRSAPPSSIGAPRVGISL